LEYATWRQFNDKVIEDFTNRCESDFKSRIKAIENEKGSNMCAIAGFCPNDTSIQKSIDRNIRALLNKNAA
jgi:hypothetical protein